MTTEPASERGQILLMKGRDLWIFMPDISQPIRLSMSQRLTGQVANGDLARANFAGDYNATVLRIDTIDGENYYVLELIGVDQSVSRIIKSYTGYGNRISGPIAPSFTPCPIGSLKPLGMKTSR